MIPVTIIICLTVILIVAIICYKEYRLSNNDSLNEIRIKLKLLQTELEINDRILGNLAESISYIPKEHQNKIVTCDNSKCKHRL